MADSLKVVELEKIWWKERFREDFGDIEGLADSIREKGILQPVTVSKEFELLAGERRLKAAKMAGLKKVPALIREKTDALDKREVELMENVFRKDFSWAEECALIQEIDRLYKERDENWSGRKTAQLLNKSVGGVSMALDLARAVEKMPELAELKTADEARKLLKKAEEQTIVAELRKRQDASLDKGLKFMMRIANGNYAVGDVFDGMRGLRTNGVVDLIECDPPYGIDLGGMKRSKDNVASNVHSYNEISAAEYPTFLEKLTKELYRIANDHCWMIFWFGPTWFHEVKTNLVAAGWQVDDIPAVWTKNQGQTNSPEIYLGRAYEPFFVCRKGLPALIKRGRLNVFAYPNDSNRFHPTQRPMALMEELLATFALPGSTVFVPFLGSGITLRAAYKSGMKCFGYDVSGEYKDRFLLAVEEDSKALGREDD